VALDWLAAHREHPVDNLYTRIIENLPPILLGFSMEGIAGFIAFRGVWGLFIHSNVMIRLGALKYVLGSPKLHHWHHSIDREHCNYANLMPIMDVLFGTYYEPDHMPDAYGIKEDVPHSYVTQLIAPLTVNGLSSSARLHEPSARLHEPSER
jgi:sterol desaturase/sphingolipid hydroxylase (fatty acid hydroxylase superfamily)